MDLKAVRTFVAVADAGQFQKAAVDLSLTQQAVSKRVAALERELGVRLLTRTPRGAELTIDGQAFLPHARELLRVAERAAASVRPDRRPLRVDVIALRGAASGLMRGFHRTHPEIDLDVMTLLDIETAVARITREPAEFLSLRGRGTLVPGAVADVTVVDLDRLGLDTVRLARDLPGGGERLYETARGYRAVVVGGQVSVEDDALTGVAAGTVV